MHLNTITYGNYNTIAVWCKSEENTWTEMHVKLVFTLVPQFLGVASLNQVLGIIMYCRV